VHDLPKRRKIVEVRRGLAPRAEDANIFWLLSKGQETVMKREWVSIGKGAREGYIKLLL
jgi:hypothetical protein